MENLDFPIQNVLDASFTSERHFDGPEHLTWGFCSQSAHSIYFSCD